CDQGGDCFRAGAVLRDLDAAHCYGVPPDLTAGEESADYAVAMAASARLASDVDLGLAVGPFPQADSPSTSPGEVHFAIATRTGTLVKSSAFAGHPEILKPRAAKQALNFLRLHLLGR